MSRSALANAEDPIRRLFGAGWVALLVVILVLTYATLQRAVPLSAWQYPFYGFLVLITATPLATEVRMRGAVTRRMEAVAMDPQARVRHRFVAIRVSKRLGRRPRIESRYAGGAFELLTIAPRYATRLSPGIPTDVISMVLRAFGILAVAASGRVLFVALATLGRHVPDFSIAVRPRRARRPRRNTTLPSWIVPRAGSDPSTASRVGAMFGLAGLGPDSGIQSITVWGGHLAVLTSDASERSLESALAAADLVHSLSGP